MRTAQKKWCERCTSSVKQLKKTTQPSEQSLSRAKQSKMQAHIFRVCPWRALQAARERTGDGGAETYQKQLQRSNVGIPQQRRTNHPLKQWPSKHILTMSKTHNKQTKWGIILQKTVCFWKGVISPKSNCIFHGSNSSLNSIFS